MSRCEVTARHWPPPAIGRMRDDQRDVVLLAVGDRALRVQLVGAVHVAVVGGEDDDRPVGQARGIELGEHRAMLRSTSRRQFR